MSVLCIAMDNDPIELEISSVWQVSATLRGDLASKSGVPHTSSKEHAMW